MRFYGLTLVTCMLLMSAAASACTLTKSDGTTFRIFNALLYKNLPEDLAEYCIEPINVMYAWEFFPNGPKNAGMAPPSSDVIAKAIHKIKTQNLLTVVDVEHWPLKFAAKEKIQRSVQNYLEMAKQINEGVGSIKFGFYGVIPVTDFSRAIQPNTRPYLSWIADNENVVPIAAHLDAFFPSLYTITPNQTDWVTRAQTHRQLLEKLDNSKPVYPFIWPEYHDQGGKYPPGSYIPEEYWEIQLKWLKENADGFVIWGGHNQTFSPDMRWWQTTKTFISKNFSRKANP